MLRGIRKEYRIRKEQVLVLKNFTSIFIKNDGGTTASFGGFDIEASQEHKITTGNVVVSEDVKVSFESKIDCNLYVSVITVKDCK